MPLLVVGSIIAIVTWAAGNPLKQNASETSYELPSDLSGIVNDVDRHLEHRWQTAILEGDTPTPLTPAKPADDLLILRRLSLSLMGTVPSLEEIRQFEADEKPDRLKRWTLRYLNDPRFADYFAERLARSFVSAEGGTFILYRRDRFVDWLRDQLQKNRPYDQMVREMISSTGLWTGNPATNFLTATYNENKFDVNKLTGRSVRAFLGQRIDCAQCHDHFFADWKQHHFQGLAAFYGQARLTAFGIEDKETKGKGEPVEYVVEDRLTQEKRTIAPQVPFQPELLPDEGTRRERLAAWITHPQNRRFERATVNRIWALLFGRQYTYPHYPVDDIPDPDAKNELCDTKLLDIIGKDFREHDYDLQRLILVITSSRAFRLSSSHPLDRLARPDEDQTEIDRLVDHHEQNWAIFPLTRLRPEQVIGSMIQTASARTIDQHSHLFVRLVRFFRGRDFVEEYGDLGGEELVETAGTIPQALLRMNGRLPHETLKATPLSLTGRLAFLSGSSRNCVEVIFLVGLGRRPTEEELKNWVERLDAVKNNKARGKIIEDLYWAIYNSPQFSWNH
ncbi:MAG: hypothetical protein Tsb009_20010 [Planctomycetaceae bacterium]